METMTPVAAVKAFFNQGTSRPVTVAEMMEFWRSCSAEEKTYFSTSAASQLGVELKQTAVN